MCNRYRMTAGRRAIAERYGLKVEPEHETLPPPELFPKRPAWIVRESDGVWQADVARWGIPRWGSAYTNIRTLGRWRDLLTDPRHRCLVPVTDFCEWSGEAGRKIAHWFSLRDVEIFSFAGIWTREQDGDWFSFLTCGYLGNPAAHIVGAVHPKACPVILEREDERRWLEAGYDEAASLAVALPSQLMQVA